MVAAVSFARLTNRPEEAGAAVRQALRALGSPAGGGLVFLSGMMANGILACGEAVARWSGDVPFVVASGAGVLNEHGDHEQVSATAGIVWRGARSSVFAFDRPESNLSDRIAAAASQAMGTKPGAAAVFACHDTVRSTDLFALDRCCLGFPLVGGGVFGRPLAVQAGAVLPGDVAGIAIHASASPLVRASSACRLLGELRPVTKADGALLLRIGDQPALEALAAIAPNLHQGRVVLLVVGFRAEGSSHSTLAVRGIRGVHEGRGGIVVTEDVVRGDHVGFAVIDAAAAREDLERTLREMTREAHGGVPLFGLHFDCAGRGSSLYGVANVDVQAIRGQWPSLPFAGIKLAYEIGPGRSGATMHLYSGVVALFHALS